MMMSESTSTSSRSKSRSGSGSVAAYTAAEVAEHSTTSDCWVVVHGAVCDVTAFLRVHPGGVNAIGGAGRSGTDVTSHFDRIGHSENAKEILKSFQIGVLSLELEDNDNESGDDEGDSLIARVKPTSNSNHHDSATVAEREHAVRWHAARRRAILRDHPEVSQLIGSNPWTCVIGLLSVVVHCYACMWVQSDSCPWYLVFFVAYTVGAVCKMYQFSVNHDICHGTAGSWLEKKMLLKQVAMQIMTLPTMGGAMHTYYEFQHIGHHASLGVHALADVLGVPNIEPNNSWLTDLENKEKQPLKLDLRTVHNMLFFPDSDGDLFAIANLSFGKILERWRTVKGDAESGGEDQNERDFIKMPSGDGGSIFERNVDMFQVFHKWKLSKVLLIQTFHVSHQLLMAAVLYLQGLLMVPIVSIPMFLFPNTITRLMMKAIRKLSGGEPIFDRVTDEQEKFLYYTMIRITASVGLHAWVSLVVNWWLLFGHLNGAWSWGSVISGFFYLYLSELFLYGFAMHPFMGYFLGVHRSGGVGFESENSSTAILNADPDIQGCQPTMSTYSFFASAASLNLTHHVEHHDFPGVPWSRLPDISRIAPEYYDSLEQSPGFCATIYRWIYYSGTWGYACH
jgi:fatty acid desaturase